jgi:hypothetical protein
VRSAHGINFSISAWFALYSGVMMSVLAVVTGHTFVS